MYYSSIAMFVCNYACLCIDACVVLYHHVQSVSFTLVIKKQSLGDLDHKKDMNFKASIG